MVDVNDQSAISSGQPTPRPGPFMAKVISNIDPTYMGILEVELLRPVGNSASEGELHQVKYMSPFYGITDVALNGTDPNDYNNTQKSYGMWMIPPDVGQTVVVIFLDGDPRYGYWIGCIPDTNTNFMTPGIASAQTVVEDVQNDNSGKLGRVPVAEYNKKVDDTAQDPTQNLKPQHPLSKVLQDQGLLFDDARGITTSSARREAPSMVFGISTPGPIDKQSGAKQGTIGKKEWAIPNAYVSRLGGTTFVMDDGDDKFLRKTDASSGPPEYASVENSETDGQPTLLHNELFRIRTRTGHQILFHNTEDLIYISNARGTSWIELTSDGKIDIFAQDSISIHTGNDLNLYADRDINMECGRNFNLKVAERHQTEIGGNKVLIVTENNTIQVKGTHDETIDGATKITINSNTDINVTGTTKLTSTEDYDLNSGGNNNFTAGGSTNILSGGNHIETASNIHMNGPSAASAASASSATAPEPLSTFDNPTPESNAASPATTGTPITSIMARIPTIEPYPHHENLDPTTFKTDKTDREAISEAIAVPSAWSTYSTATDTFKKNQ
jgi:hypothetical protein